MDLNIFQLVHNGLNPEVQVTVKDRMVRKTVFGD